MTEPLYRRLLASRYDDLPGAVQRLHDVRGPRQWRGEATVGRGASLVARTLGAILSLPPATAAGATCAVVVTFTPDAAGGETWSRAFFANQGSRRPFVSYQRSDNEHLIERVGFTRFAFLPHADATGLRLKLERFYVFGLPMPAWLQPRVRTMEHEQDDRYHFDVEADLPLGLGPLVRYRGWLMPEG